MAVPYKGNSGRSTLLWTFLILIGVGLQIFAMFLAHPYSEQLKGWILVIGALPLLVMIIIALWVDSVKKRQRIERLSVSLKPLGINFDPEPKDEIRNLVRPHLEPMEGPFALQGGVQNIVWLAYNEQLLIFEHEYTTGSGKSTQVHSRTVIAWSAHAPIRGAAIGFQHPLLVMRPRVGEGQLMRRTAGEDVTIGDAVFDKSWLVYGSQSTALNFLTDAVRSELMKSPRGEQWMIGSHWVACSFVNTFDHLNFMKFYERVKSIMALASP